MIYSMRFLYLLLLICSNNLMGQEIPFINAKLINDEFNFDIKKINISFYSNYWYESFLVV
jgi:hypothetical protein